MIEVETKNTTNAKRIHLLPIQLANQIAAGEVIERPASVLKEVLENSLDAGSTQIEITIEKGGIRLIRVQDNGSGICKEDLKLALAPHATSKIQTLSDLEGVISYGFRGEALASIASVSKFQLSSGVESQETAFSIRVQGREGISEPAPIPKRQGTCVEIKDLFYNTPARRKFLRSEKTEAQYIEEVFKRIALSQPAVVFNFQMEDRVNKRLPACKNIEGHTRRVAALCGKSFIENAYYIQAESNDLKLSGWLGSPKAMRAQADLQYFYVNGRIVRDKVVTHAIRQAYQELCLPGRFPAYVLYFELDPAAVDVNVHPTKHEVRFRESRTVHAFLSYAVQEGLKFEDTTNVILPEQGFQNTNEPPSILSSNSVSSTTTSAEASLSAERNVTDLYSSSLKPLHITTQKILSTQKEKTTLDLFKDRNTLDIANTVPNFSNVTTATANAENQKSPSLKPLTLLGGKFLLLEGNNELIIADIEKIQKEKLCSSLMEDYHAKSIATKLLLFPKILTIGEIAEKIEHLSWDAKRLGFEWDQLGPTAIVVRSFPTVLNLIIEKLQDNIQESLIELISKLLLSPNVEACIAVIANFIASTRVLSLEEAVELFQAMEDGFHSNASDKSTNNSNIKSKANIYKRFTVEEISSIL